MKILIRYQGITDSPWMNQYFEGRLNRLRRYLAPGAQVDLVLTSLGKSCTGRLLILTPKHEYQFDGEGGDLFEAFSTVVDESLRILRRDHQKLLEKVHQRFGEGFDVSRP